MNNGFLKNLIQDRDKKVIPLEDATTIAALKSSPTDLCLNNKWLSHLSELTGLPDEEIEDLVKSGEIDKFLSKGFYTLSLIALQSVIDSIESGELPPEKVPDVSFKAAEIAQKLSGRDIKKHLVLSADLWQKEAEDAVKETIDIDCEQSSQND